MAAGPAPGSLHDEDDTGGKPVFLVRPAENVYSYFMFIGPTESKKSQARAARGPPPGGINWDVVMGYVLFCGNFFMQSILLILIFEEVVISNVEWQNGILKLGGKGDHIMGLLAGEPIGCNEGGSLCFYNNGGTTITCAPPSIQLTGRWEELDTDNDGIWTRKEVTEARDALKCKYFVDPVEVFDMMVNMVKEREVFLWLHPDIKSGKAIHLPYFTYIMSDVIMCSYRSEDMCANLIERGYFDAPLKYGTAPRVGRTIESALRYCRNLLAPGGMCERHLPSTYAVWKVQSTAECGAPVYGQFKYTNPGSNATKTLLSVDYSAPHEYVLAQDTMFQIFKSIILFTWLLLMLCECRDIVKILTFCGRMPDATEYGDDAVLMEQDPSDPEDVRYRIQGITNQHRWTMVLLCFLRFLLLCVTTVVGLAYLIKTNDYADLIMNGIALVFISAVSSVLYSQVLREEIKDQTEDIKSVRVLMYGIEWLNKRPAIIDILCVLGIWIAVYVIMRWQLNTVVLPVHESLECTCLSQGDRCMEAQKFSSDFWHEYWLRGVPGVFTEIARLKASVPAPAASYLGIISASGVFPHGDVEDRIEQLELMTEGELQYAGDLEREEPPTSESPASSGRNAVLNEAQAQHKKTSNHPVGQGPLEPRLAS